MNELLMAELAKIGMGDWIFMAVLSVPPFLVMFSRRVHGGDKWRWIVFTGLFSWVAYFVFLFKFPAAKVDANTIDAAPPEES